VTGEGVSQRGGPRSTTAAAALLVALYTLCLLAAPAPAFVAPGEGASWALMDSLADRWWTGVSLAGSGASIDPQGEFAGSFVRARDGRWYSKAPPLLPLAASFPYAVAGALGAFSLPAVSVIACLLIAARIGDGLTMKPERGFRGGAAAATGAIAATPLVVHGALFCGHAPAAALCLGGIALFLRACELGFPASRESRRPLLGAGLCALLAALAQPDALWVAPASLAAWAVLREGRFRIAASAGARWRVAFLALTSALHVLACLLVDRLRGGAGSPEWGPEWGSEILIPVVAPAALAVFGLLEVGAANDRWSAGRGRMIWTVLVTAGLVVQGVGFRSVIRTRHANARLVNALAVAASPGEAIITEDVAVPSIAAVLAPSRPIFHVRPEAAIEDLLAGLDAAGVRALTIASPVRAARGAGEPLAARRALGRFKRVGETEPVDGFLIARLTIGGQDASRPSTPPRGD
jgi:hypothetical protein